MSPLLPDLRLVGALIPGERSTRADLPSPCIRTAPASTRARSADARAGRWPRWSPAHAASAPRTAGRSSGCPDRSSSRCRSPTSGTTWAREDKRCCTAGRGRGRATGPTRCWRAPGRRRPGDPARTRCPWRLVASASLACHPQARATQTWHSVTLPMAARLDVLDDAAVVVAGVDLRAHLRGDAGLPGSLADEPRLLHVVRERLLAVDVLLQLQGGQRGERVRVLGGADNDGVELARDGRR